MAPELKSRIDPSSERKEPESTSASAQRIDNATLQIGRAAMTYARLTRAQSAVLRDRVRPMLNFTRFFTRVRLTGGSG
jgi:hypothetical protein